VLTELMLLLPTVRFTNEGSSVDLLPSSTGESRLKVEPELSRQRARRHIVRSAEGGEEVIECRLLAMLMAVKRKTPFVMVAFEQILVAHRDIEQAAGCDARRIVIVIFSSGRGHLH
jgi:hypothetical protein